MFRTALALLALLITCAMPQFATAQDEATPIRIACVGDSITFGAGIKDRKKNNYPTQLQGLLGESFAVQNFGVSGATLLKKGNKPYWKLKQFQAAQELQPNIVVIKLGTNDTKPNNWKHKDEYQADYLEMIEIFQQLDSKPKIYLCYPAPVIGEQWGINDKTVREEVIPMIDAIAKKTKLPIIDLYAPLKDKPELIPDKVHPNAEGATIIAETVAKAITAKEDE
ncbi:MAG: GDSL-type esterase/lipase family protein [Phycisphaeraceae bacterium]